MRPSRLSLLLRGTLSAAQSSIAPLLLAAAVLAGCTQGSDMAGIDGTGVTPIVGFGRVAQLGSVWVNGTHYDTATATFTIDGKPGTAGDIQIGDVVLVEGTAEPGSTGATATRVTLDHVLVGPIASIDLAAGTLVALGQTVEVTPDTLFDASIGAGGLIGLADGDAITVSGFRSLEGGIVATRVGRRAPASTTLKLTGAITSADTAAKRVEINGLTVDYTGIREIILENGFTGDVLDLELTRGVVLVIEGTTFGPDGELVATSLKLERLLLPGGTGDRAQIEGYVTSFDTTNPLDVTIAGLLVTAPSADLYAGKLTLDAAIEVEGTLDANRVLVAHDVEGPGPPVSALEHTIQGTVFDPYSGPVEGAWVDLWVQTPTFGYSYTWAHGPIRTDAAGGFRAPLLPDAQITIHAGAPATPPRTFYQQCAVILDLDSDLAVDIEVASAATLSASNPPPPQSAREPTLTGTIFETTATGRDPIAGASLWPTHLFEIAFAETVSDAAGRYYLCSLPPLISDMWVGKPGYKTKVVSLIDTSQSSELDIELERE